MKNKSVFVTIEGGLGKNIMSLAVLKELKNHYEKLYVSSPYSDIFQCCSWIDGVFQYGDPSVYRDLIMKDSCDVFWRDPYNNGKFIKRKCHLYSAWLEEFEINSSLTVEKLDNSFPEIDKIGEIYPTVLKQVEEFKHLYGDKYIVVQFTGGQSPLSPTENCSCPEPIKRNYPIDKAKELVELLSKEYPDYVIVNYAINTEPGFGIPCPEYPYLAWYYIIKDAFKVVCIDSSLQHLAASQKHKDTTVIWGETQPEHFGHPLQKAICAKDVEATAPYFRPFGYSHSIINFPESKEVLEIIKK